MTGCGNADKIATSTAGITKEIIEVEPAEVYPVSLPNQQMYTTTRVNVREHSTIDSSVTKELGMAEKVDVLYTQDGWSYTDMGWIKSEYLSENQPQDKLLVTEEERYWLYQLVEAEAGNELIECRKWICSVVFNQMQLEETPDNVVDVIFYKNLFSPTLDGRIYSVTPRESTKQVVDQVLREGVCTDALYFEADYCHSEWHSQQEYIAQIDHTIFYR